MHEPDSTERPLELARSLRELGRALASAGPAHESFIVALREQALYESAVALGELVVPQLLEQAARDGERGNRPLRLHALRASALANEPWWRNDAARADALRGIAAAYLAMGDAVAAQPWFERGWCIRPPEAFARSFAGYRVMPDHKALALALDSEGHWTYGFFTGLATEQEAVDRALEQCRLGLERYGVGADCRIYALDGEVVWEPSEIARCE